jgi:8-oxo-dGTP pyrophosphatase MutT (NUDIX family)
MKTFCTVHAIAKRADGKYLITQRGKGGSIGDWRPVSGFIEERESAEDAAQRELKEETNLSGKLVQTTKPFWIDAGNIRWVVIASLIKVNEYESIKIDKSEILDYRWVDPNDPVIEKSKVLRKTLQELGII